MREVSAPVVNRLVSVCHPRLVHLLEEIVVYLAEDRDEIVLDAVVVEVAVRVLEGFDFGPKFFKSLPRLVLVLRHLLALVVVQPLLKILSHLFGERSAVLLDAAVKLGSDIGDRGVVLLAPLGFLVLKRFDLTHLLADELDGVVLADLVSLADALVYIESGYAVLDPLLQPLLRAVGAGDRLDIGVFQALRHLVIVPGDVVEDAPGSHRGSQQLLRDVPHLAKVFTPADGVQSRFVRFGVDHASVLAEHGAELGVVVYRSRLAQDLEIADVLLAEESRGVFFVPEQASDEHPLARSQLVVVGYPAVCPSRRLRPSQFQAMTLCHRDSAHIFHRSGYGRYLPDAE